MGTKQLGSKATGITSTPKTASGKKSVVRCIDPQDDTVTLQVEVDDEIEDRTEMVKGQVKAFVKASESEKAFKTQKEEAARYLREYVCKNRDENAIEGDYQKTYRVLGTKGAGGLQYAADVSQADKFSLPKDSQLIEDLRGSIDSDLFDENFEKVLVIQIKPEILKNDKTRREFSKLIVEAIGVEGLKKYFQKEEIYEVKEGLDQRQYAMDSEDRAKILGVAKQAADSVKDTSFTE